jgi:hypothetical protein
MDIQQAWQTVLDQLQMEMPRASFDSWVRDTRPLSFENDTLTIGVRNAYARDWLESRLVSTVSRLLIGIMNRRVDVEFVVAQTQSEEDEPDEPDGKEVSISTDDITSIYDQVVRPERAIYLPAYFRKHLAQLGPDLGWMYLGFRQAAYGEGARAGKKTARFSGKQIAALCGVTERTFWNRLERPQTWEKLAGLVTPIYGEAEWMDGPQPRRLPRKYTVAMTLPLTAADAHALMRWLREQVEFMMVRWGHWLLLLRHPCRNCYRIQRCLLVGVSHRMCSKSCATSLQAFCPMPNFCLLPSGCACTSCPKTT